MSPALTAMALTFLYVALMVADRPLAASVGIFYLAAVLILVLGDRVERWKR